MGDNGAGKSTLVKIIAGNFPPSAGTIALQGEPVALPQAGRCARRRASRSSTRTWRCATTSRAAENVFLGRELMRGIGPLRVLDYRSMFKRAGELFAELKSETRPRDLVRKMSGGQRQAVAIARTRLSDPKIVLMDEPTAAISVRQVAEVLNLIRRLRDHGIAVVLISHRMPDVFAVADRIVVLRRGEQGGRQGRRAELAGRGHRPHHRRDRDGVRHATARGDTPWPLSLDESIAKQAAPRLARPGSPASRPSGCSWRRCWPSSA